MGTSDAVGPAAVNPLQVTLYVPAAPAFVQTPWAYAAGVNTMAAAISIKQRISEFVFMGILLFCLSEKIGVSTLCHYANAVNRFVAVESAVRDNRLF
jgi:hypothetical protein